MVDWIRSLSPLTKAHVTLPRRATLWTEIRARVSTKFQTAPRLQTWRQPTLIMFALFVARRILRTSMAETDMRRLRSFPIHISIIDRLTYRAYLFLTVQ